MIFDSAAVRRLMRGCNCDAVGQTTPSDLIMYNDDAREGSRGGCRVVALNDRLDTIAHEDAQNRTLCRAGKGVSIATYI